MNESKEGGVKQLYEVVKASEELPEDSKPVFARDVKGIKYSAFYTKGGIYEVEFEDDDLPEYVISDGDKGILTLKEGWYEECENNGYYDFMVYKREIVEWLKPIKIEVADKIFTNIINTQAEEIRQLKLKLAERSAAYVHETDSLLIINRELGEKIREQQHNAPTHFYVGDNSEMFHDWLRLAKIDFIHNGHFTSIPIDVDIFSLGAKFALFKKANQL